MSKSDVKIKRTFMRDEAYDILQEWIMIGRLDPGTKLRDQELSDLLGISRTPIREALLRLEDDGLVVTKANRWTLVAPIDVQEAENIYSIVEALEVLAVEQGLANFTKEDIKSLEKINDTLKKHWEQEEKVAAFQADTAFHEKIIQPSNNSEIKRLLKNLKVKIQRVEIHYFSKQEQSHESYVEHEKIIAALKKGVLDQVISAIRENWHNSLLRIQKIHNKLESEDI
ncbi:GntR family transcriptional regulator [Virgibacillus sp. W0181]|uniref:GntR family transcriptional regulator n=1 Tax=Virgibacillus sp. W0181 TaxID=3391581 RepID=UPI003F46EBE1